MDKAPSTAVWLPKKVVRMHTSACMRDESFFLVFGLPDDDVESPSSRCTTQNIITSSLVLMPWKPYLFARMRIVTVKCSFIPACQLARQPARAGRRPARLRTVRVVVEPLAGQKVDYTHSCVVSFDSEQKCVLHLPFFFSPEKCPLNESF